MTLVNFLNKLFQENLGYSGLNTARSAVSSIDITNTSGDLGTNPLVKRFLAGAFNIKPTFPKSTISWDTSVVLRHIKGCKQACDLSLKELTLKLTMLLALLTAQRVQTLSLLDVSHMVLSKDKVIFKITSLLKQTRPGVHLNDIILTRFQSCRRLCVVTVLIEYIKRTKDLRQDSGLLISFQKPHKRVTRSTIARWLKMVLAQCGIDKQYGAHSTRGASTSKAKFLQVPIDTIMKSAGWSSRSTFSKHYHKPIQQFDQFANSILQASD